MNEVLRAAVIGTSSNGGWGHNIDELFIGVSGIRTVAVADDINTGVADAMKRHRLTRNTWVSQLAKNAREYQAGYSCNLLSQYPATC